MSLLLILNMLKPLVVKKLIQKTLFGLLIFLNTVLQIKTCLNCGRYFIPSYRQNEIYCDLANPDQSPTCREKGANEQYKKNLENNETQALYRRIYRQKFMIAQRNKDVKVIQKEFEKWKKDAKDKVNKMKKGKLAEDEVYKWLVENK